MPGFNRRKFLIAALAASSAWKAIPLSAAPEENIPRWPVCLFVKFLQSMSDDDLARTASQMGFQGIEATVRKGGQIAPERVEEELPKLVQALKAQQQEIQIMASNVNRADAPLAEKVLRIAADLGIKRYRMDYYRYDLKKPVEAQLRELKPVVKDLAALNRELGIQGIYQNHAGAGYVGASIWDLHFLLEDIPREQIGIAYDTRHSTVEAGQSWPVLWNLVQPHLAAVYVKNARWEGRIPKDIPLHEAGTVDPAIFTMLKKSDFHGPVSLHVEYLPKGNLQENLAAIKKDFQTLQEALK